MAWNPFVRFPRTTLLLTLAGCVLLGPRLGRFHVRSETRVLLEGDARNLAAYEKAESILGDSEVVLVNLHHEALFTNEALEQVRQISEAFTALPDVWDVKSLTHSVKPVREGLSFRMVPFVPDRPLSPAELEELRRFCLTHPLVRNLLVSADGRNTLITVTWRHRMRTEAEEHALRQEVERVLQPFREQGLELWTLGLPLVAEEIRETLAADLRRLAPVGSLLLALVLWLTFRSWRVLVVVLANQVLAALLLPAIAAAAGLELHLFSAMALPLLGGIQLTLWAHVFSALARARAAGLAGIEAMSRMALEVGKPSCFAALTTLAGLASLLTCEVAPVRDFARLGALGLVAVFVLTFGPGMAMVRLAAPDKVRLPGGGPAKGGLEGADWAERWVAWGRRHRTAILAVGLGGGLAAAVACGFIRTDIRAVEFLGRESPTRQALEALDAAYGGINAVQIEFDTGRSGGVNEPAFLRALDRIHREVEAMPEPSGVYSYASLLAMMNQIWEGGGPESLHLPENPFVLGVFVVALRTYDYPFLRALADREGRRAWLVVRTRDMPASRYLALIRRIEQTARRLAPPGVTVSAAEGIHTILEADRRILRSQARSLGLTAVVVAVLLALLWRSVRLAAVVVGLNLIPLALAGALAALGQMPLNSVTVMVAATALGLAVDDSIHLVTHWRDRRGLGAEAALVAALRAKARPVVWTSVILILVFQLPGASSFPPGRHFGWLGATALAGALGAVLVLLPVCLPRNRAGSGG